MRTNNAKVRNTIISVYFVLIVMAIVLATVFSAFSDLTSSPFLTFGIVVLFFVIVFFVVHAISKYFEYDSDGMKVVLINKGLIITDGPNSRQEQVLEFSKENPRPAFYKLTKAISLSQGFANMRFESRLAWQGLWRALKVCTGKS